MPVFSFYGTTPYQSVTEQPYMNRLLFLENSVLSKLFHFERSLAIAQDFDKLLVSKKVFISSMLCKTLKPIKDQYPRQSYLLHIFFFVLSGLKANVTVYMIIQLGNFSDGLVLIFVSAISPPPKMIHFFASSKQFTYLFSH